MSRFTHSLCLLLVVCLLTGCHSGDTRGQDDEAADSLPMLVTQVRGCSRLYTTEYHIHKVVTHDDVVRLRGSVLHHDFNVALPLGERKIAIPMDAVLKAYIDLSDFSADNVERQGRKIVVTLPDPQLTLTSSKIRQQDIHQYVGLVRSDFTDSELTTYEQQGREAILRSAADMDILPTAQANATRLLVPMLTSMGFREEDITIVFRRELTIDQLIRRALER